MISSYDRVPRHLITSDLAAVAMGKKPADLIIKNGRLVDVCTARIRDNTDIAVYKGYIALVGDASHVQTAENTRVLDVSKRYLCPGLIDSHMHVESSMVDLPSFAAGVLAQGTTTICPDIHELTNVLGMGAVDLFYRSALGLPLKVLIAMPVCVPSLPGMEDAGAVITPLEVHRAYESGKVFLQGEQMNFPGVIFGDETVHQIIAQGMKANKVLTGHYAGEDLNAGLNAYIASGMTADHETTTAQGARARAGLGMYVQQRYGSAWLDLPRLIEAVTHDPGSDTRFYTLVTDDVTSATIVNQGHLVRVLRKAIQLGTNPVHALQMVTINAAQMLEAGCWIGSLTPGRAADILVVDNLAEFNISQVFCDGALVAENNSLLTSIPRFDYPNWALDTMHLDPLDATDFQIPAPSRRTVRIRVIQLFPGQVHTLSKIVTHQATDRYLEADPKQDLAKAGMFFRHSPNGTAEKTRGMGFVSGTKFLPGSAYASTVSHDCHNLLVVGMDDAAMALAANTLIDSGGGLAVVMENRVLAHLPLPLGGIMGLASMETTASKIYAVEEALAMIGCPHKSFEMTLSLLGLVVLGELRLSNRGLVELKQGQAPRFVDLILDP
ncbi:MAG: amidohydrolase family protein [Desulfotignum sp.]|nr:amidohydrolase family protein [Desulfotignum sp.]